MTDIIIIGAGASGLMAALTAAEAGASVLVLEKMKQPGRKLLATGNGRCNFTNLRQEPSCYRSDTPDLAWEIYSGVPAAETVEIFERLGIPARSRGGYLYPMAEQARAVLQALTNACQRAVSPVKFRFNTEVTAIRREDRRFLVYSGNYPYEASCVVLAAGGKASPVYGADGAGYRLAESFGLPVTKLSPALTGIRCKEQALFLALNGVRVQASLRLRDGFDSYTESGEVQFAKDSLSGIPAFQLSRYVGRSESGELPVTIDFVPEMTSGQLAAELARRGVSASQESAAGAFLGILPEKAANVLEQCGAGKSPEDLAALAKYFPVTAIGVRGYEDAQVTAGGVPLSVINPATAECLKQPGLYLTGELLDVDGICGGYNLQWAWTTGILAGRAAAARAKGAGK